MRTNGEEADGEIRSTTSDGWNTKHALLSLEAQGASVHSEEPQRVTDDDGRMNLSRGKRGAKNTATRRQDRRNEKSAIDMNGGLCLVK